MEYFKKQVFSRDLTSYNVVESGDFAYATIHLDEGSIGISPERCLISPMYTTFRVTSNKVHAPYLLRYLKSAGAMAEYPQLGQGSAERRRSIPFQRLAQVRVPVPEIEEQWRIAVVLDHADMMRTKRLDALARLDDLESSIFLEMFGDVESRRWPTTTVAKIASPDKGSIRTGPFGSQLLRDEFVDDGIAVLGIDNAVTNEFRWRGERFITNGKYQKLRRYTVRPGDVLITIMGTCGRCAIVPDDIPTAINTKHLCSITLDRERCLPEFLHSYFLRHPSAKRYLTHEAKGAIMSGLNTGIIKNLPIPIPPLGLQHEFARRVEAMGRFKAQHRAHLAELDALFASLQYRAFRGEL